MFHGEERAVSRRDFLKIAGIAGGTVGVGAGLGGLLAACGADGATTTTAAPTSTSVASTTTQGVSETAGATTTASAGVESGEEIKLGFVTPLTGPKAAFGIPDKYCKERAEEAIGDGLVCGDGKKHPVTISMLDCQSDSNRAAQVAGDLINNEGVKIILAAATPDTVVPVADQAEANATPCLTGDCPWQMYVASRSNGDLSARFEWTYHFFWGMEDHVPTFLDMWGKANTNQAVGGMWANDSTGNAARPAYTEALKGVGYTLTDPGAFQNGTEDYTEQISVFKKNGCEIVTGFMNPPDFTNFWSQSKQQSFKPKIATVAVCLLFPEALEALGDNGFGLTTEQWWSPAWPFKSSLTGETCQQFADEYEKRTGSQWTQPLFHYAIFEMAAAALRGAKDPTDKQSILEAAKVLKVDTISGPIDFTAPINPKGMRPAQNVYKSPLVGGQWVKGTKHKYDLVTVSNEVAPNIPVQAQLQPLV